MSDQINAADLGLALRKGDEASLFKWFLASFLFGKRIQQNIARQTYRVIVERHGRDTPLKLCHCSRAELVRMLGEGRYTRYDESTAQRLLAMCRKLQEDYGGRVAAIFEQSASRRDLEKRLEAFKGVGPKTAEIFLRDAAQAWA